MSSSRVGIELRTYAQQAYAEIRRMIIDGTLPPGSKVVVRVLAERLGLSPTPIKSALAGLERDGFLVAVAHRGYFVPEVSGQDMREIYELREVLDGIAARNIASRPEAAKLAGERLRPLLRRQRTRAQRGDVAGYSDVDVEFHRALWHAAGNSRLAQVADNLLGQLRFGSGSTARVPGRMPCALEEHESIIEALEAGDPERAERVSREHVRRSAAAFEEAHRHADDLIPGVSVASPAPRRQRSPRS
ncbi:MAG: GntR family transcriptional regulator [Actinocatenispora sp.]